MELTIEVVRAALRDVLEEEMGCGKCKIAPRWQGGKIILQPFDSSQQNKEIPIAVFFKKITAVREKLRVLEQKINNNENLPQEEKLELQQFVTRCYGSLTTFNFLFRDDVDKFAGVKGE